MIYASIRIFRLEAFCFLYIMMDSRKAPTI